MNLKPLLLTVGLLAVCATATWFLTQPPPQTAADPRVGSPLVDTGLLESASKFQITQAGKSIELTRSENGTWTVPSYHNLDADLERLAQVAEGLGNATWKSFVTNNPESLKRLDLGSLTVTVTADKHQPVQLQLGRTFEGGGRFVRLGEEQKAFLTDLSVWIDSDPKSWVNSALLPIKAEDIASLEVPLSDGRRVTIKRTSPTEAYTSAEVPAGKQLKASQVTSATSALTALRFSETRDVNDKDYVAATAHARSLKVTTFAGRTFAIDLLQSPAPPPADKTGTASDQASSPEPVATATPPPQPVFVRIRDSESASRLNTAMTNRAFETYSYVPSSFPLNGEAWWEDSK
ncbi:MAG: DUF4340 domain-containing protein [Opitutaceae bacterium]|nr:DUF4340 domain-containing protein [Opitutaceae bacterium]